MSIQRVSHLCFRVSDLERSRRFYEDVLGFRPLYEIDTVGSPSTRLLGRTDIRLTGVWLERDGFTLQLQQLHVDGLAKPKRDTVEIGYSHVGNPRLQPGHGSRPARSRGCRRAHCVAHLERYARRR